MKYIILSGLLLLTCTFCTFGQYHEIFKPVQLEPDKNEIHLNDFFTDLNNIFKVSLLSNDQTVKVVKNKLYIDNSDLKDPIDFLKLQTNHGSKFIPLFKSNKKNISIEIKNNNYKKVSVAGSFNGWNDKTHPMKKVKNKWILDLDLNEGVYQYQLVCDGKWIVDPDNEKQTPNGFGAYNSLLDVKGSGIKPIISSERIMIERGTKQKGNRASYSRPKTRVNFKVSESKNTHVFVLIDNEIIFNKDLENNNHFQIIIPEKTRRNARSYLRVYAFNENGRSNDQLIPISYGEIIKDSEKLNRKDIHTNIMYFVMIDRFNNGDKKNDKPLKDKRVDKRADYNGGDLKGIINKYEEGYFEDLGVNTLWISPVTDNVDIAYQEYPEPHRWYSGYHGYWPKSNLRIEEHFGTENDFRDLVNIVHRNDHNIILDFVSNHVHEEHPMIKENPEWKTRLDLKNGEKNIRKWDEYRLTTWFDTFLPTLDYSNKNVTKTMVDTAFYWLKEYKIDGYRHDATKHIPNSFWRALTLKIKNNYLDRSNAVYQIGETFGNRALIGSYIGNGMLDAQFDFNLYFDIRDVLLQDDQSFERVAGSLSESMTYYGSNSLMGNITGNHDLPRFIGYAGEAFSFDENPKEVGWERKVSIKNKDGYKKLSLLHAFVATLPGIPCIYYGDEIGLVGADDPDNRRPMKFDKLSIEETETKSKLSTLLKLRKDNIQFMFGSTEILFVEKEVIVLMRKYFDQIAIVAINKSNDTRSVSFDLNFKYYKDLDPYFNTASGNNKENVYFDLPAYGYEVLLSK